MTTSALPIKDFRIAALRRFATAITLFNVVGHLWLGFEQAWIHPIVAVLVAYGAELLLETVDAWAKRRPRRFAGGAVAMINFLLPAHITALAVSMLLYPNSRLSPIVFGTLVAIASKYIFRIKLGERLRHFLNPSNFGITATLLCFPWVGIAMPYMFTENLGNVGDVLLPCVLIASGSFLNIRYTRKIPLITAWLTAFALQAFVRSLLFDTPLTAALLPMTGVPFLLFTFYMVSDPSTTPRGKAGQVAFGAGVAGIYGLLLAGHIVFTLFFSLTIVCFLRGGYLLFSQLQQVQRVRQPEPSETLVPAAQSSSSLRSVP